MANTIFRIALTVALVCVSATSYSSSIIRSDGTSTGYKPADQSDLLMLNPPNEYGVSYNNFSQFVVSEKPLNISAAERLGDKTAQSESTRLIIIHANDVMVQERITLLGQTADILLISNFGNSTGYGRVTCSDCAFENFGRVSLVAGRTQHSLGEHTNKIGTISSLGGWSVNVSNLHAPGIAALDILSRSVNLSGTISTQYGIKKDSRGG